jgi:hypothetical protein
VQILGYRRIFLLSILSLLRVFLEGNFVSRYYPPRHANLVFVTHWILHGTAPMLGVAGLENTELGNNTGVISSRDFDAREQ